MRLAVFRGGFSRDAAQSAATATLKTLAALVNKSLLRRHLVTGRYEAHELIRQYAEEKRQQSGLDEQSRNAHAAFFAKFSSEASTHLVGSKSLEWMRRIEADLDNLRAALTWLYSGGDAELGLRISVDLWLFFFFARLRAHKSIASRNQAARR